MCIHCLQNLFDVINKGKWVILGLILSKINALFKYNFCIFHWHTEQKDILSIKIFINLFFTTWQAIPFKRKFYFEFHWNPQTPLSDYFPWPYIISLSPARFFAQIQADSVFIYIFFLDLSPQNIVFFLLKILNNHN